MTPATVVLCLLVAAFICAAVGAVRSRDPLHIVNTIMVAIVLVLLFARGRWIP